MRRFCRRTLFIAVAALLAAGCSTSRRPYAHDPLLRDGAGIWGNPVLGRVVDHSPVPEPDAPRPPKPIDLPTLEWETASHK